MDKYNQNKKMCKRKISGKCDVAIVGNVSTDKKEIALTESTTSKMPSTILRILSTSPPKSACPGVSTRLNLVSLYLMAQFCAGKAKK